MKNLLSLINNLCNPAKLYLLFSVISVLLYIYSMNSMDSIYFINELNNNELNNDELNNNPHQWYIGRPYTMTGLIIKIIFTFIWIILLNYICMFKHGTKVAWVIVLIPFILLSLVILFSLILMMTTFP